MEKSDIEAIEKDWKAVGGFLTEALLEAAEGTGDSEIVERVARAAAEGDILPEPSALLLLESIQPGIARSVVNRAAEIQVETHQRELTEFNRPLNRLKRFGKGLVSGVGSAGDTP